MWLKIGHKMVTMAFFYALIWCNLSNGFSDHFSGAESMMT